MRQCEVQGCDKKHRSKGYCSQHYFQFYRTGSPLTAIKEVGICCEGYCDRKHYALGFCQTHYKQFRDVGATWPIGSGNHPHIDFEGSDEHGDIIQRHYSQDRQQA